MFSIIKCPTFLNVAALGNFTRAAEKMHTM